MSFLACWTINVASSPSSSDTISVHAASMLSNTSLTLKHSEQISDDHESTFAGIGRRSGHSKQTTSNGPPPLTPL